eukprot:TRINITY_DN28779_c0_g1_i1.p1 TRINITY_DN28779_c0_g1~~TRINITY_DN28779_c0_g1_i1.p1  ORF type:complete len:163 (-),score=49.41 TRINITY_DN28779_c0_g1_i1:35-523(-)
MCIRDRVVPRGATSRSLEAAGGQEALDKGHFNRGVSRVTHEDDLTIRGERLDQGWPRDIGSTSSDEDPVELCSDRGVALLTRGVDVMVGAEILGEFFLGCTRGEGIDLTSPGTRKLNGKVPQAADPHHSHLKGCLLYTSDAADDLLCVDLGGRRIIKKKKRV